MGSEEYTEGFWSMEERTALRGAKPILLETSQWMIAKRVVDVGCGTGVFSTVAKQLGAQEVISLDGNYVPAASRKVKITEVDFETQNLPDMGRFDLGIFLEVSEHLTASAAQKVIDWMCGCCTFILFSGAIPGQGGYHHINEQWPEYWFEMFAKNNFQPDGRIRHRLWLEKDIPPYYRQNIFLMWRDVDLPQAPGDSFIQACVNPDFWKAKRGLA